MARWLAAPWAGLNLAAAAEAVVAAVAAVAQVDGAVAKGDAAVGAHFAAVIEAAAAAARATVDASAVAALAAVLVVVGSVVDAGEVDAVEPAVDGIVMAAVPVAAVQLRAAVCSEKQRPDSGWDLWRLLNRGPFGQK